MDRDESKLDFDWNSEPKNPTDDARKLYHHDNLVVCYDYTKTTEFVDDDDYYCSSWDNDDYEYQRKEEKKMQKTRKKLKKLSQRVKACESRIAACESDSEEIKSEVSFLKKAHCESEKKRKRQLYSNLIDEPDRNKHKELSIELFDDSWGDDIVN